MAVTKHGRRFGHPGEWCADEVVDEDDEDEEDEEPSDAPPTTLYRLYDPISNVEMVALSRESLARGWLNMLAAHARERPRKGWATIRQRVLVRDGYACVKCGQSRATGAALHVDHILPVVLAGDDHIDNLRTLCADCNLARSARPFDEFVF